MGSSAIVGQSSCNLFQPPGRGKPDPAVCCCRQNAGLKRIVTEQTAGSDHPGGPYSVRDFRGKLAPEQADHKRSHRWARCLLHAVENKGRIAMRLDKWLWAARFFKTRAAAQQAIEGGKIRLNGERTRPARELKAGDMLVVRIGDYEWLVTVTRLSDRRGPASVARTLYEEDPASHARRQERVADRRLMVEPAAERHGRPTKRERRQLERWRRGS